MTFYHVYADESRQDGHRFMLYGLLLIPRGEADQAMRAECADLRLKHGWNRGEFKWEKVSAAKLHVYKEFVDLFFAQADAQFRCLVVDRNKIDYKTYHHGDYETEFYEFYFQAISRNLQREHDYWVYADARNNRQANRWEDLKAKINYHWAIREAQRNVVRVLEPRNSKEEDLLQIADVLLGAVGYDIEERSESPAKVEMVRYIEQKIGCSQLREHQGRGTRFNIWKFRFPDEVG